MYRKALAVNEGLASQYGNLGIIYRIHGDFDEAESLQRKSLELYEEVNDQFGLASMYLNLGRVQLEKGDKVAGCESLGKAKLRSEASGLQDCLDFSAQLMKAYGCEGS